MTLRLFIPIFLLGIAISGAARFKGACPQTPPTHRLNTTMEYLPIIRSIPFSPGTQEHQYVFSFPEINSTHTNAIQVLIDKYKYQEEFFIWFTHYYMQPKVEVQSIVFQEANQSEMTLSSVVHTQNEKVRVKLDCLPPFLETVKMWMDEYFLIIWACVPVAKSGDHEEAVLLMKKDMLELNGPTVHEVLNNLRDFSTNYLSKDLVERIDWEPKYGKKEATWNNTFVCPRDYKAKYHPAVIIGGYIVVIGIAAMVFYGNCGNCCKSGKWRNQVSPYVI